MAKQRMSLTSNAQIAAIADRIEGKPESKPGAKKASSTNRGAGKQLVMMIPEETHRSLRMMAADKGTTLRAVFLELAKAGGAEVPEEELKDRRIRNG